MEMQKSAPLSPQIRMYHFCSKKCTDSLPSGNTLIIYEVLDRGRIWMACRVRGQNFWRSVGHNQLSFIQWVTICSSVRNQRPRSRTGVRQQGRREVGRERRRRLKSLRR
jgi:hypothetical protein